MSEHMTVLLNVLLKYLVGCLNFPQCIQGFFYGRDRQKGAYIKRILGNISKGF